jgi:hypothetical protein
MSPLPRLQPVLPWLLTLSAWLLARSLNLPEPLVHATGMVVFAQVEAFESSVARSLCPARLARRCLAWCRLANPEPRKAWISSSLILLAMTRDLRLKKHAGRHSLTPKRGRGRWYICRW